ncbi:MAG TPA: porin [Usitatibacter sp.]|nr:porin [Usitatibacter sp.]
MKLIPLAAALALAFSGLCAHAQTTARDPQIPTQSPTQPSPTGLSVVRPDFTVTLYGLIDGTLSYVTHANTAGDHLFDWHQAPWFSGSRWGITGRRDLGMGGLNAIFKLESEYLITTGEMDTPNVLFNRDAWLGFQGPEFGKLTFGRQNTLPRDFAQIYGDPYGSASVNYEEGGWTNTNQFKQLIYYAGSVTGTRYDKGVVYKKLFDGGLALGLGYQFGGVAGDFSRGTTKALGLAWNGGNVNIAGIYNNGNRDGYTDKAWSIGGNFTTDIFRINAGYFDYTAEQGARGDRKDKAWTISTKIAPRGKIDYELGYQQIKVENAGVGSSGNVPNPFAGLPGGMGVGTGKKTTIYGSVFYHFNRFVETYLAADYAKFTDTYRASVTHGFSNVTELAVGVRLRF